MKTKYSIIAALALVTVPLSAQETYQDTKLVDSELNGTARYVGMGGAMEALEPTSLPLEAIRLA